MTCLHVLASCELMAAESVQNVGKKKKTGVSHEFKSTFSNYSALIKTEFWKLENDLDS